MSKLANTIKMMVMLKSNKLMSREEIARNLGVNIKEITAYKNALSEVFDIETVKGRYGGYKLANAYFPFKAILTETEMIELKILVDKLEYSEDNNEKFKKVIDKINFSILNSDDYSSGDIISYSRRNKDIYNEEIELKIYKAVLDRKIIIIEYLSNQNEVSRRRVQPYKYFVYRGESYLVGYCLEKNAIRFFKFIRIKECTVTGFIFERNKDRELEVEERKNKGLGIFDQEEYDLEIEISPPMSNSIKERIWVENQEIIELEDGKILFKAQMKGEHSIISWILTMREFAKVNKPDKLRVKVIESMEKMLEAHRK
ncbi:YafY family protein [uncultured Clostridium sp.]|uniref:helix-turn-helix transcriptional regulator n=1 Tax=uncultured Clostridium sp. TaxID=59620 RepID=UPI0026234420|nr:WYL domain-containing protein [uncultured Clostridium sp.]